mgnify:CR=1 FL=1
MIYFIQHTNFIKIGYTDNIEQRLSALQTSCPIKLKVLAIIEGSLNEEKEYHIRFSKFSSSGEWFKINDELLEHIYHLPQDLMWKYGFVEYDKNQIGEIKKIRLEQGLSLEYLGSLLNCTKQSVSDMEKREIEGRITLGCLSKAADVLGYKFEYKFFKNNNK